MDKIIAVMRKKHRVDLSSHAETFLVNSVEKHKKSIACHSQRAYLKRLSEDAAAAESLSRSLRVSHSEFFRNPLAFSVLEQIVLPNSIEEKARNDRREIRVWCAGCATGQEAWSVAILLDELCGARGKDVPYRIFATDVSEPDLAVARECVYSAEALGNVRLRHLNSYFSRQGESYAVIPRIRPRVDFSVHDLLNKSMNYPSACIYGEFDLVLCNNVLLYYKPEAQRFILNNLQRSLANGGVLMTDASEKHIVERVGGFRLVAPPAPVFRCSKGKR